MAAGGTNWRTVRWLHISFVAAVFLSSGWASPLFVPAAIVALGSLRSLAHAAPDRSVSVDFRRAMVLVATSVPAAALSWVRPVSDEGFGILAWLLALAGAVAYLGAMRRWWAAAGPRRIAAAWRKAQVLFGVQASMLVTWAAWVVLDGRPVDDADSFDPGRAAILGRVADGRVANGLLVVAAIAGVAGMFAAGWARWGTAPSPGQTWPPSVSVWG